MKKKEQQQMLKIQSFPLSGVGDEQVSCMEFKHSSFLGAPQSLVQAPPRWGDSPLVQPCSEEL